MNIYLSTKAISARRFCRGVLTWLLMGLCQIAATASLVPKTHSDIKISATDPDNIASRASRDGESTHRLIVVTNPSIAGTSSASIDKLQAGETASLRTTNNRNFTFKNWTIEDKEVSMSPDFDFEMPDYDVTIVANYYYNPESPGNPSPEEQKVKHPVVIRSIPSIAGSFSPSSSFTMDEQTSRDIYAYPGSGWEFIGWTVNGQEQQTKDPVLNISMDEKALDIAAYFNYNPTSPMNPASNYYNSRTGEVIVDDFTAGGLFNILSNLVGYNDFSLVKSIIVKGMMDSYDMGIFSYIKNAEIIDLSRVGGIKSVSAYTFSKMNATDIILPASVGAVNGNVFDGCENLTALTVYAQTPPICTSSTFENFTNKDNCTVFVPASAIELYSNAKYWEDFTILPITQNVHSLQINLPEDASDGCYKNNSLEIVNVKSGLRQKYVITDRMIYTFNNLLKDEAYNIFIYSQTGLEIGRIENVVIPDRDIEVTFDNLKQLFTVSAKVATPDGSDVTPQVTIEWLKPLGDGTTSYLRKATSLSEIPEGEQLICRVTLDNKLGLVYANPGDVEYTAGADNKTCNVNLAPFRSIVLSGTVVDGDGAPLPAASISVIQMLNGSYSKTYTTKTDLEGLWSVSVLDAPETRLIYAANECINVNDTIRAFAADVSTLDLGKTVMKSIAGARVTYGFTYLEAGADKAEESYPDYQNVTVSVFNVTQNREHKDVSLQYPVLAILDENVQAGDVLRLTATSKTGAFNPIVETVTVGGNQRAEVTFNIIGKGGIVASFEMTDNPAVIAMLYSDKGELLKTQSYSDAKTTFNTLEDGEYTVVSMGQSDKLNSILRLSSFAENGLTEDKDYVKKTVKVESGKLSEIKLSEIPKFDESLLDYTSFTTDFSTNKSSITTGNFLTLRAAIDFKEIYKNAISNVALVIDLPEACDLVEQSVIQGPNLLPYTLDNNRLTIQLGNAYQSQTRFCVIPTIGGSFTATASIEFDYDGRRLIQPIGSATAEIKDMEISVPASTATGLFCVSGVAPGKSEVNVFIDGTLCNSVYSNAVGNWTANCEMPECDNFSSHQVYAEIINKDGVKLTTETKEIIYNPFEVEVRNVHMTFWNGWYKRQYSVDWNFINNEISSKKYDFYTTTDFTFIIGINYHDIKLIPIVWLHVYLSDGTVRSMIAQYDEHIDKWTAVSSFSSNALPVNVTVGIENMIFALDDEASYNLLLDNYVGEIKIDNVKEDEDGTTHISFTGGNGDNIAEIICYETPKSEEEIIEDLGKDGYELDEYLNDDSDYVPEDEEDVLPEKVTALTDSVSGSTAFLINVPGRGTQVAIIRIVREEGKQTTQEVTSTILRQWRSLHRTYFDSGACAQVNEYIKYTEHLDKYVTITTSMMVAHTVFIDPKLLPPSITNIPKKQILNKIRRIKHSTKTYTTKSMEYSVIPKNCKPRPPKPETPPTPPVEPILDPSGFVYEAVPTNRVEGVQASIYYKETKEDMYGDPYEEIVLWDAEDYAQKNPLFTDENGMYQWDVPQGLWQVKFEKDGYVTAYSEWLPVPPPQLDVNVAIVQNKQPEVKSAHAYEEGVEVQFDKYMDLSTMTTAHIYVTANGEKLNGEIRLIDSALADEYASEDDAEATRYASRVRFVPEKKLDATTGEIRLTVSRNVLSYAGIPMAETYSQVLDVEKEVKELYADDMYILYGKEKEVTIYALPFEAAAGRKLHIASSSDLIASVDITEATFDAEGKAVVKVKGELPGVAQLIFNIDDTNVTGECAVEVVTEINIDVDAPQASRASGTAVYRGTTVELTTDTKGAKIYYTTDGSCPCDEYGTRIEYTEPIVIDGDMQILAMASVIVDDEEEVSETAEFNYTLKRSDMDFQMAEGWTWMSHNFERSLTPAELAKDEGISRIQSQSDEVIRDPEIGMIGTLTELTASQSYKIEASAATGRQRISDVACNPANPISISSGWNWIGYPSPQTMTVDEAFAPTAAETLDIIVGQNGFAQFDGEKWIGTLETMSPGMGYMYYSQSAKDVVYNTSIVSKASAKHVAGIVKNSPLVLDIHKYGSIMPVVATINDGDGAQLDNEDYQVAAFCGTECRGIGKVVKGHVMMNVYGNPNDHITFRITDNEGQMDFANDASLKFSETAVGHIFEPYVITINDKSGIGGVTYDGNIKVTVDGDMLRIKGIASDDIDFVEVYDLNGQKLIRETRVSDSGIRISHLSNGVFVVIVNGNGEYTYHKIAIR